MKSEAIRIAVDASRSVAGVIDVPAQPTACFVMAHGAGADMNHPFMAAVASGLCERGIATLRYQFVYMELGSRRPDRPALAHAAVRAAAAAAATRFPGLGLVAGGKSFGARMTSQAQAEEPLADVRGLAFLGFPLHPAGEASDERAAHLSEIAVPLLFLQGSRDKLAELALLQPMVGRLGKTAQLRLFEDADHSFHVPARSGRTDAQVMTGLLDALAAWIEEFS